MEPREFAPKSFNSRTKILQFSHRNPAISAPRYRHRHRNRRHNKSRTNRSSFEVRRAPNMAAMASSRSAFLERCDALRGNAGQQKQQQQPRGVAVVRCDARRSVSRRQALVVVGALFVVPVAAPMASRALLEADDDESLLEKVKEDKKKRIQKRTTAINEFVKESEYVQVAVYKLSEAGQAIDGDDYSKATAVLAQQNADWIRDIQAALSKVSSNSDEKAAADNFRTALSSLQAAVKSGDSISSRTAFIASAEALDRWTRLTGLSEKVVGL